MSESSIILQLYDIRKIHLVKKHENIKREKFKEKSIRDRRDQKRCDRDRKRSDYLRGVAEKLTNIVVDTHDNLMKASLERMRKTMCESYDSRIAWQNIVSSQTHLLGLWHSESHQPKSLVLERRVK